MVVKNLPVDAEVRIGRLYFYDRRGWMCRATVNGRPVQLYFGKHATFEEAERLWTSVIERYGHPPKPKGKNWWWNGWLQCWWQSVKALPKGDRRKKRLEVWNRERREHEQDRIAKAKMRQRHFRLLDQRKKAALKELREQLKEQTCEAFIPGVADLAPAMKDLRSVAFRQAITPMRWHKDTSSWYCWIGVRVRKLVMLGQAEEPAKRMWLLLKHGLEGGSRILLATLKKREADDKRGASRKGKSASAGRPEKSVEPAVLPDASCRTSEAK